MLYLAIRMARQRISALIAVACAVLGGAALVTATGVLAESGLRSHLPVGRFGGVDIVVSANQIVHPSQDLPLALPERDTVPADVAQRLARIPGVTATVADVSFPAALIDTRGQVVPVADPRVAGHGWASTGLLAHRQVEGAAPTGSAEVALDSATAAAAGVRPGATVRVVAAGRSADYRVSGVVRETTGGIFFADSTALRLAGRDRGPRSGTIDLVALRTAPGMTDSVAEAIRSQLRSGNLDDDLTVATGPDRGDIAAPEAAGSRYLLILLASSLAGIILLIVGFVIAGALAVSIAGQRRELALVRAVGATPQQIRRLAAGQATVVAIAALLPGVALGYLLVEQFRRMLAELGVLPAALPLTVSPLPALAAVLLLLLVVQVSARGAAWRASRIPATEALAESRSEPRNPSRFRTGAGLLLITAAITLSTGPLLARSPIGAATTSMAGIIAAIGLALSGPALLRSASNVLVRRLPQRASAPTWLAVANLRDYVLRFAGAVTTLAMAVIFVLTYALAQTTVMTATSRDIETGTLAETSITATGLGGLPDDLVTAVTATAGVHAAGTLSTTTVLWPYRQFGEDEISAEPALILTPDAPDVLDLGVAAGSLSDLTGTTIAVSKDAARTRGAELGRTVSLILGDGAHIEARVVAMYERNLGFGSVVLSRDLAAGHTTTGLDQSLLVRTDGTGTAERNLAALVADRPGLTLENTTLEGEGWRTAPPEVWINLATITVLLGYLLLGIANKLLATTAQRRNEIATLQLIGTTPRQIRSMMRREAGLICAAALSTGLLLAAVPLVFLGLGFLDRPWPAGPAWLLPATALTVVGIAFLAVEAPIRRMLRTPPVHALANRE